MPSSKVEIISPLDGRGETRNFLLICAGVLALAVLLLSMIDRQSGQAMPELPHELSNMATQISNAVEEVALLEEAGLISQPYQLIDLPLPSFKNAVFEQLDETCFSLFQGEHVFVVERQKAAWTAHWATSTQPLDCHAAVTWHSLNQ
ncbi:hypothetical protein MAQ5080_01498 [Marinomonas aquimarina]|uniref:Uncharacterized protein n=1 Tax=Marinomonas aquimarina TaxID=295068 RepID=A0A1A8TCW6_9GAMM|nr:hypothetical protein [Marinomonas aquimarina]SBS29774.1 hypothetical protein MAQ5080_01498 [Marinomonas aquimarina]